MAIFHSCLFRLKKADLVLIWCRAAERNGITGPTGQLRWIKEQIEKRVNTWLPEDNRFNFIKSLRKLK